MELHQLRTFLAVAGEGNLTRAARQLHASQPAVTAQIKALEEELALRLFQRTARGMRLTPAGLELLGHAESVLAASSGLLAKARRLQDTPAGVLRIGVRADAELLRLNELHQILSREYPGVSLRLTQAMSAVVIDQVRSGRLDGGFVYGPFAPGEFTGLHLLRLPLVVIGPAAWQERLTAAGWQEIAAMPWVCTPADCPFHFVAREAFSRRGLEPCRAIEADSESTIMSLVASGAGLGLQLARNAEQARDAGRVIIWARDFLELDLSFIFLQKRQDEPLLQALAAALARIWPEIPGNG